jgi:beta-barrel assembly-enhancing protease
VTSRRGRRLLLPLLLGWLAGACGMSERDEVAIGRQNAEQIDARIPLVRDPVIGEYMQQLGLSLARTTERADLDWRFLVVNSPDVNAFALPGGIIYVNRGLIERTDRLSELAGAIGHEIGHVVRRHSVEQMEKARNANVAVGLTCTLTGMCDNGVAQAAIQVGGAALFAKYSREDELEADSVSVEIVTAAGIDPEGIPALFERLLEERRDSPLAIDAFFASHPLEEDRIREAQRIIAGVDPERLRGLAVDVENYRDFTARLAALPAPPPAPRP